MEEHGITRVSWGSEKSFTQLTKVSVSQLLHGSVDDTYSDVATYKGFHLNRVEIMGMVINEKNRDTRKYISVDDGSGIIDCLITEVVCQKYLKRPIDSNELQGRVIRVMGNLFFTPFSNLYQTVDGTGDLSALCVLVDALSLPSDCNEEYIFWMEVIRN
ncbi:hypothetical protein WA556_002580, partial [Blastocystis sp. ATCC 50177/Nand II]